MRPFNSAPRQVLPPMYFQNDRSWLLDPFHPIAMVAATAAILAAAASQLLAG